MPVEHPKLPFVEVSVKIGEDGVPEVKYSGPLVSGEYLLIPKSVIQIREGVSDVSSV